MDRATRLVRRIPPLPANGIDSAEEKEEGHVEGTCNEFPWLWMSSSVYVKVNWQ